MEIKILTLTELEKRLSHYETPEEAYDDDITGRLFDDSVHYITAEAAQLLALMGPPSGQMNLDFIEELSTDVCAALLSYSGDITINYFSHLSDSAAAVLSEYKGGLEFGGINELSDEAIESLAKIPGRLSLFGLRRISKRAAIALSQRKATTVLNDFAAGSLVSWRLLQDSLGQLLVLESDEWDSRLDASKATLDSFTFGDKPL
jgi:hypothetical protein